MTLGSASPRIAVMPASMAGVRRLLRWEPGCPVRVVAHRGAPLPHQAENSLATFENALSQGADFIELDVRASRDGWFVLCHDEALERCTTGRGPLNGLTLEELRRLRLRGLDGQTLGDSLPTFDEAIDWARGRTIFWLDANPPLTYAQVLAHVRRRDALPMVVVLTYCLEDTLAAHQAEPEAMIYSKTPDQAAADRLLATGIPPSHLIGKVEATTPSSVYDFYHQRGILVNFPAWDRIDRQAMQEGHQVYLPFLGYGANIFNTDNVTGVRAAIAEAGG